MNRVIVTLLLLLSVATTRPVFKKTGARYVSYSSKPLAKGVVAFDKDETINSLTCNTAGTSLTLKTNKKPTTLKKGVLITGGKEWGCNKKEFFFNITSVGVYKSGQLTLAVKNANKEAFFEGTAANEGCKKLLSQAQSEVQAARKQATSAAELLKKASAQGSAAKSEATTLNKRLQAAVSKMNSALSVISKGASATAGTGKVQCDMKMIRASAKEISAVLGKANVLLRTKTSSALSNIKNNAKNKTNEVAAKTASQLSNSATVKTIAAVSSKLLAEIKKVTTTSVYKKAQTQTSDPKNTVSRQLKTNVTAIISKAEHKVAKAKTCKTNSEAKEIATSLKAYLDQVNNLLKNYSSLARAEVERQTTKKTDAHNLNKQVTEKLGHVNDIIKRCTTRLGSTNAKIATSSSSTNLALQKELTSIKSEYNKALSLATKYKNDANKLNTLKTIVNKLYSRSVSFQTKVDKALKKTDAFDVYRKQITSLLEKAENKTKELKKDAKDLAAKAVKSISAARAKQQEAVAAMKKNLTEKASSLMKSAYKLALDAKNASSIKAAVQKYTTATKKNGAQRVAAIHKNLTAQLNTARENIAKLSEYSKEKGSALLTQLQKFQKQVSSSVKQKVSYATDKAAQTALDAANKLASAVTGFAQNVTKEIKEGLKTFDIKPVGNVFSIPESVVQSVKCDGQTVTILFKKKVHMDLKVGSIIKGASGCYDENTKKKGPYTRKISAIKSNLPIRLVVKTDPTSVTDVKAGNSTTTGKIEFTESPAGSYETSKPIVVKLRVSGSDFIGKEATVAVLNTDGRAISGINSQKVSLKATTTVKFIVPKKATAYNAYVKVTCGKETVRSEIPFNINSDVRFVKPSVNNQKYFTNDELELEWKYSGKLFHIRDVKISFINLATNKEVYSFGPSAVQRATKTWSEKVKNLPQSIKNGKYKLLLKVDEVQVNSMPFEIVRTGDMFTKITFTKPKHGTSYNKGDMLKIAWAVENAHTDETMDIYLDSEDDGLLRNIGDLFDKPILKGVKMETRCASYPIDAKPYGSSKYFLKAKWKDGQEVKSDLFTLNKASCFSFDPVNVTEISEGKYKVVVNFKKTDACNLQKDDDITLELVKIGSNDETNDSSRSFKVGNGKYSETYELSGKFNKVRFLAKHKDNTKGEPSDDFDIPLSKELNFTLNNFGVSLDCTSCPSLNSTTGELNPVTGEDSKIQTATIKYTKKLDSETLNLAGLWKSFCLLCGRLDKGLSNFVDRFQLGKSASKEKGGTDSKKKMEMSEVSFKASFGVTCKKCNVFGKVQAFNLDKDVFDIKSASLDVNFGYSLEIEIKVGLKALSSGKVGVKKKFKSLFNDTKNADALAKASKFSGLNIPILGVSKFFKFLGQNCGAEVGLMLKLSLTVSGEITFTVTSSGEFAFKGSIESDTNRKAVPSVKQKPTFNVAFKSVEISTTVSASLDATIALKLPKTIAFRLQFTAAKLSAKVALKIPYFGPTTKAYHVSRVCLTNHLVEVTISGEALEVTAKFELLGKAVGLTLGPFLSKEFAKLCLFEV